MESNFTLKAINENFEIVNAVEKICSLSNVSQDSWEITDFHETESVFLVMVNLTKNNDREVQQVLEQQYPWLRAMIVDLRTGTLLTHSFYPQVVVANNISVEMTPNKKVNCLLDKSQILTIAQSSANTTVEIQPMFEGTSVRVFKYKGVVYFSNHSKFQFHDSCWNTKKTFGTIWNELGGPSAQDLFSDDKQESCSEIYSFIMCHPDLLICSHIPISKNGYLIYLGSRPLGLRAGMFPSNKKHFLASLNLSSKITAFPNSSKFIRVQSFDNSGDAISFLNHGYSSIDKRHIRNNPKFIGEGVMIIEKHEDGSILSMTRVHSLGYDKRFTIRGYNSNLEFQLYNLYTCSYKHLTTQQDLEKFIFELFDSIYPLKKEQMLALEKSLDPITDFQEPQQCDYLHFWKCAEKNRAFRFSVIYTCLLMSVPLAHISQLVKHINQFYVNCVRLSETFASLPPQFKENAKWMELKAVYDTLPDKSKMINTIYREKGIELFKLIRLL